MKLNFLFALLIQLKLQQIDTVARCSGASHKLSNYTKRAIESGNKTTFYLMSYNFLQFKDTKTGIRSCVEDKIHGFLPLQIFKKKENWILEGVSTGCNESLHIEKVDDVKTKLSGNCSNNDLETYVASTKFYSINSPTGFAIFHACKFWSNENVMMMTKSLILLQVGKSSEINKTDVKTILSEDNRVTDVKYSFLENEGFCACDDLVEYFNDCRIELNDYMNVYCFAVIFIIVVVVSLVLPTMKSQAHFFENPNLSPLRMKTLKIVEIDTIENSSVCLNDISVEDIEHYE
jgi:hypothetical protein